MIPFIQNIIIVILATVIFISCDTISDFETRKAEINKISRSIDSCIGWFKDKNFDLLFSVVATDSNYLSIHPTDRLVKGFENHPF